MRILDDDAPDVRERAGAAIARGDREASMDALFSAARHAYVRDADFTRIVRGVADLLARDDDGRAALTAVGYLAGADTAAWARARPLHARVPPLDRAWALAAQGALGDAAREMESAARPAASAIYRERAGEWRAARATWARMASTTGDQDTYIAALVRFNLGRCAQRCGDAAPARQAFAACVRRLEEAADHFESLGQRERAFDCFQVLVEVGRESGTFENVLEGYVNATRILSEDHLGQFALERYDAAIEAAARQGEITAAATFAREAARYARSLRLPAKSLSYTRRQAELWEAVAEQQAARGAVPESVARALLAAVLAFGELGQARTLSRVYGKLAALDLTPERRAHYESAMRHYADADDRPLPELDPAPPSDDRGANGIWHSDVLEWERRGSAVEACGDLLVEPLVLPWVRRHALVARLLALPIEPADPLAARLGPRQGAAASRTAPNAPADDAALVRLAAQLARVGHYGVISALESIYAGAGAAAKLAVLDALRTMFFKRSFVTVRAALRDSAPAVAAQAARTIEGLFFPHAFDPLCRIYRETPDANVRASVLIALARIDSPEASAFVREVFEHGAPADRDAALRAIQGRTPSVAR